MSEWLPVADFEGLYEVDRWGNVRRIGRAARVGAGRGGGVRVGRTLKAQIQSSGYLSVQLWKNGKPQMRLVHRLVAAAFIGPCPSGHEVNHIDGRKSNPYAENLEYVTRSENNLHAYRTGLRVPTIGVITKRRRPRRIVECACGCGAQLETPDGQCRDRRFVTGHNRRIAPPGGSPASR